jgi:plasmid stabilization system protein ParE
MHPERPILRGPLAAKAEVSAARGAAANPQAAPRSGPSPSDGFAGRETWRRVLAAHVQPLPDAAD